MPRLLSRNAVQIGAFLLAVACAPLSALAQGLDDGRIQEVSRQVQQFMVDLQERNASLPDTVAAIRESRERVEEADQTVTVMIADLTEMTERMDVNSDFRQEIVNFDGTLIDLIAELEVSGDEVLIGAVPDMKQRYDRLREIDKRRASAVIEARAIIRDLEESRDRIKLLIQIGEIDRALEAMDRTVGGFEDVLAQANDIVSEAVNVSVTP